jgi:hypothetical protein
MREGHDTLYLVLLSIFTLTLVKVKFGHFWHKVSIKSLWGDFGDISGLRELNPGGPPGYILSCGKKGLKAQEVKAAGKR